MNKRVLSIVLVAVLIAGAAYMALNKPVSEKNVSEKKENMAALTNPGVPAPSFSLTSTSGETVDLDELKGERVYIKFWASWCSICLAGMDELDQLSKNSDGFRVITIVAPDINGEQSKEEFIKWFKGLGYENIEVLFDESGDVLKSYGIRAYPTSAYIGSDGVLVKVAPGHMSNDKITAFIETLY